MERGWIKEFLETAIFVLVTSFHGSLRVSKKFLEVDITEKIKKLFMGFKSLAQHKLIFYFCFP